MHSLQKRCMQADTARGFLMMPAGSMQAMQAMQAGGRSKSRQGRWVGRTRQAERWVLAMHAGWGGQGSGNGGCREG